MKKEKEEIPEEVVERMIAGAWAKKESQKMLRKTKWQERIKKAQEEIEKDRQKVKKK